MCEPTPTFTVFSVTSSTIYQTITTSSAVVVTPSPIISTYTTSSCVSSRTEDTASSTQSTSASQPQIDANAVQKDEEEEGWRGRRERWRSSESTPRSMTSQIDTVTGIKAIALNAVPSADTSPSFDTSSSRPSASPSRHQNDRANETWAVGSALRFANTALAASSTSKGPHLKSHLPTARALHRNHKDIVKRQQCAWWTTVTGTTTIVPEASTSWKTEVITTSRVEEQSVPVQTLYASCTVESVDPVTSQQAASSVTQDQANQLPVTSTSVLIAQSSRQGTQGIPPTRSSMQRFEDNVPTSKNTNTADTVTSQISPSSNSMVKQGNTPTTISVAPTTNPLAGANEPPRSSTSVSGRGKVLPSGGTGTDEHEGANSPSTSKGTSSGAIAGGVIGLLLFMAGVLFVVRWWRMRKRQAKTRELRSSWFYGGDVAEHHHDSDQDGISEKSRAPLQSRFSAPSLVSRTSARVSRSVPAFLALPINHIRQSSGRFPAVLNDLHKSWSGPKESSTPAWATKYGFNTIPSPPPPVPSRVPNDSLRPTHTTSPPVAPVSVRTVEDALAASADVLGATRSPLPTISVPINNLHITDPDLVREPSGSQGPPRLDMPSIGGPALAWGHSYTVEGQDTPTTSSSESMERLDPTRSSSNIHGNTNGLPLESYYSVYSAMSEQTHDQHSFPAHLQRSDSNAHYNIGQAISAPGRESIEVSQFPLPPQHDSRVSANGSTIRFPTPSIIVRPPSNARNLVPQPTVVPDNLPLPSAPYLGTVGDRASASTTGARSMGRTSSVFEYSEYNDSRRESNMTMNTTRATRNWYDKPIWDTNPVSGISGSLYDPTSVVRPSGNVPTSMYSQPSYAGDATISRASRASRASAVSASSDVSGVWTVSGEQLGDAAGQGRKSRGKSVRWGDAQEEPLPKVFELARAL